LRGHGPILSNTEPIRVLEPDDRVADANGTAGTYLSESAARPRVSHRCPKTRQRLVHRLTWRRFPDYDELNTSDLQDAAAGLVERHAADEQVGAASARIDLGMKLVLSPSARPRAASPDVDGCDRRCR
jgi:hypothetical protein